MGLSFVFSNRIAICQWEGRWMPMARFLCFYKYQRSHLKV